MYWDVNSLYPTEMVEPKPVRNFQWMKKGELVNIVELCKEGRYDKIPPCTISVDLKHNPKNFDVEKIFAMCPEFFEEDGVKNYHIRYLRKRIM